MTEQLQQPENRRTPRIARKIGAFVGRAREYFAEQQRQIAIEHSIPDDRLEEMRRRASRVTRANEYEPEFGSEVEAQLHAIEDAYPETPHLTRWIAAYNRALIARLCEARCAIPYQNITKEDATTLREWGFAIPLHLGAVTSLFALTEFPDQWNMRPAHEEPSLENTTVAHIYDQDDNQRIEVIFDNGASTGFGNPYGRTVLLGPAPDHPADLAAAQRRRMNQAGRRFKALTPNPHAEDDPLPESWQRSPLGIVLTEIKYGTSKRSEYGGNGTPVLRIPNVSGDRLDISDLKFTPLDAKEADSLRLRLRDLLMIRSNGSVQLVGKALPVAEEAVGMAYAGYLMRLRVDEEVLLPEFLYLALSSPDIRHQVEMPLRSTSGINNINTDEVRGLVVPIPPIDEQHEIVRRAAKLLSRTDMLSSRINGAARAIERTSNAILAKTFRGELLGIEAMS